jgi:hypothetical protein
MVERNQEWRCWLIVAAISFALLTVVLIVVMIATDPFGAWGTPVLKGVTSWKAGQTYREWLWKPYEYALREPEVVIFGSSRVKYGIPASWPGVDGKRVYNFGIEAAHIPEEMDVIRFAVRTHQPKLVLIGLDLFQFLKSAGTTAGFSSERLSMIALSPFTAILYRTRETCLSLTAVEAMAGTIKGSLDRPDRPTRFIRGFDTFRGLARKTNQQDYVEYLWKFTRDRRRPVQKTYVSDLAWTVRWLATRGVEAKLFINPMSSDHLLAVEATGVARDLEVLKRSLAQSLQVVDFSYVGPVNTKRANYYDASHFRATVGQTILRRLKSDLRDGPKDFGTRLDARNVDDELEGMRARLVDYKNRERDLFEALAAATKHRNKVRFKTEVQMLLGFDKGLPTKTVDGQKESGRARLEEPFEGRPEDR